MTATAGPLAEIARAVTDEIAARRVPAEGVCTLASRLGMLALRRTGVETVALAVACTAFNDSGVEVSSAVDDGSFSGGHMVLVTGGQSGHLVDLSLGQFSWPEKNLRMPAYLVAPLADPDAWPKVYDVPGAHVAYREPVAPSPAELAEGEELMDVLGGWADSLLSEVALVVVRNLFP